MKRRHFLGATLAGLAAIAWPDFLHEAFGEGQAPEAGAGQAKGGTVAEALRRAQLAKKPLLVLVIPVADGEKWNRGQAFGELLNHGKDKDLAPLSDAEVVCATMADLKNVVPSAGEGDPLMVLVKTDKPRLAAVQLDAPLPDYPDHGLGGSWEDRRMEEDRIATARIGVLAGLLQKGLGRDERKLADRAAAVRARLTARPPAGARWANGSGCGTTIEGVNDNAVFGCGMGHVPEKSRRFLHFFSIQERGI